MFKGSLTNGALATQGSITAMRLRVGRLGRILTRFTMQHSSAPSTGSPIRHLQVPVYVAASPSEDDPRQLSNPVWPHLQSMYGTSASSVHRTILVPCHRNNKHIITTIVPHKPALPKRYIREPKTRMPVNCARESGRAAWSCAALLSISLGRYCRGSPIMAMSYGERVVDDG